MFWKQQYAKLRDAEKNIQLPIISVIFIFLIPGSAGLSSDPARLFGHSPKLQSQRRHPAGTGPNDRKIASPSRRSLPLARPALLSPLDRPSRIGHPPSRRIRPREMCSVPRCSHLGSPLLARPIGCSSAPRRA